MLPYIELLRAGRVPPSTLYLLVGADPTVHQDVVDRLTRGLVQNPELNFVHVHASDVTRADDIEAYCAEYPMMSRRRLVWVDGSDRLSEPVRRALASYLQRRTPSSVLVLSAGQPGEGRKKATSRKKEADASPEEVAAGLGLTLQCELRVPRYPTDRSPDDRLAWLAMEMEKRGLVAVGDARQALLSRLGSTLAELRNELDKVDAYLGDRRQLLRSDVEAVVTRTVAGSMPELSALLQSRQTDALLRLYHQLLRGGAAPFQILSYAGAILRPNASTRVLRALLEAEVSAKSGTNPELAVELLLLQVCQNLPNPDPLVLRPRR